MRQVADNNISKRLRALQTKGFVSIAALLIDLSMLLVSCSDDETADVESGRWVATAFTGANGVCDRSYTDIAWRL